MYTRVTTGRYDSVRIEEVQTLVTTAVLAAAQRLPGFKSYNGALDRKGNRLVVITTWETEKQAHAFRDLLGADLMKQIQDVGDLDASQIFETIAQA